MEAEEPTTMMTDEVMTEQQPELPTAEAAAVAVEETTAADDAPPARLMITKMVRWLSPLNFYLMTPRPLPFLTSLSLSLCLSI